jgi:hypothetical protein
MRTQVPERAPRLLRAVAVQLVLLVAVALASDLPWSKKAKAEAPPPSKPVEPPKPVEHRLRVIRLPPPSSAEPRKPAPQKVAQASTPKPAPETPKRPEPVKPAPQQRVAAARPPPPSPRLQPPPERKPEPEQPAQPPAAIAEPQVRPEPERPAPRPRPMIAADATAVHGVRLRVLIPSSPADLAAHLRNSGGCMVVSRLSGEGAEVMSLVSLRGGEARLDPGSPCDGVPRLVRDGSVNAALGDPLGQARAQHPEESGELVLQVLLTPRLHQEAQIALRQRFGALSEEEMGEKAAETGYELSCFAEPTGSVRCQ